MPEEDEVADNVENIFEKSHHNVISEEVSNDDNDNVDENEIASSTASYESSQEISVTSDLSQCPEWNAVFTHRHNMLSHVKYKHEGVKYPCSQCDYKATKQSNLKIHIEAVHEGVKYPYNQCNFKATRSMSLKKHIEAVHEGVKYPCKQSDYKTTRHSRLKKHIDLQHPLVSSA